MLRKAISFPQGGYTFSGPLEGDRGGGRRPGEIIRQLRLRQVMIGNDHIDSERSGPPHHLTSAYARIHAHDQRNALRRGTLHHFGPHAVPFRKTVRHMEKGSAAGQYRQSLPARFRQEANNLSRLTGWSPDEIKGRMELTGQSLSGGK